MQSDLVSVVPIIRAFCFRNVQSNLAFAVLQMDAFRERSVLTLRKRAKKRSDEELQKPDGGA